MWQRLQLPEIRNIHLKQLQDRIRLAVWLEQGIELARVCLCHPKSSLDPILHKGEAESTDDVSQLVFKANMSSTCTA